MINVYYSTARSNDLTETEEPKKGSWVLSVAPDKDEIGFLSDTFGLDYNLINDALDLYESPRVEINDGIVYVFARYYHIDEKVINATEPVLFIYHPDCLITILRIDSGIFASLINGKESIVTTQKTKLLLQMFKSINRSYQDYVTKITRYVFQVRSKLKLTDISNEVLLGLVEIEDDLNEILSALQPYELVLRSLISGKFIRLYEEDKDLVEDLTLSTRELIDLVKSRLKTLVNIRQAYEALATSDLNRTFKRLTSISIFLMVPAIMAGVYGMNVVLPFQGDVHAFWFIFGLTVVITTALLWYFNKKRWF
ncbi:magnesium transporter CorA family protein [Candidatus Saccharibacteria bacterium]|nr:magnesium transporter CorA family protein [Candidatus Saccharibacteria bacterium]